jgi:hypothetical protein
VDATPHAKCGIREKRRGGGRYEKAPRTNNCYSIASSAAVSRDIRRIYIAYVL